MRARRKKGSVENADLLYRIMLNLKKTYIEEIRPAIMKELGIKNIMAVPHLVKIVINTGLGEALVNKKAIENMTAQLMSICGQKPTVTVAKKDISSFKLRRGDKIGLKVTLRNNKMFDFYEKLVKIVFPRIRDFRGVSRKSFDGRGNYTLGFREQIVFPEIDYSKIDKVRGLEITFVTSSKDKKQTEILLEKLGMPFEKLNIKHG